MSTKTTETDEQREAAASDAFRSYDLFRDEYESFELGFVAGIAYERTRIAEQSEAIAVEGNNAEIENISIYSPTCGSKKCSMLISRPIMTGAEILAEAISQEIIPNGIYRLLKHNANGTCTLIGMHDSVDMVHLGIRTFEVEFTTGNLVKKDGEK